MEHYKDIDRPQLLAKIEIKNRSCKDLLLPQVYNSDTLNVSQPGMSIHFVYEDCVPQVMAMVETETDLIDQAKKIYAKKIRSALLKHELIKDTDTYDKIDFTNPDIVSFMSGITLSIGSVFSDINQRDLKPLVSCTVIEAGIMQEPRSDPLAKFRKATPVESSISPQMVASIIEEAAKLVEKNRVQSQNQARR